MIGRLLLSSTPYAAFYLISHLDLHSMATAIYRSLKNPYILNTVMGRQGQQGLLCWPKHHQNII